MSSSDEPSVYVYHEKQVSGLCGVHCLNTLFQSPLFTEVDLGTFAAELDETERQVMAVGGVESKDFLKFMGEDSTNVGDDGNFSVQVLTKALQSKKLECSRVTQSSFFSMVCQNLSAEVAFVCNKGSHWFTIRRIHDEWYDLNSLSEPKQLGKAELATFVDNLLESKHAVYAVHGRFPDIPLGKPVGTDGKWVRMRGTEDNDLRLALRASAKDANTPAKQNTEQAVQLPSPPQFTPPMSTDHLSLPGLVLSVHYSFGKCAQTMEKLSARMTTVETQVNQIKDQQQQKQALKQQQMRSAR
jgi:ataxin-3